MPNNTITRANLSNNGAIRNIHYGDVLIKFGSVLSIRSDDIPFIKNTDTVNNNVFLKNGDIVIADTAEDETVGKVTEIFDIDTEKVVSGLHTIPCRPKKNFAPKFLGYYMNSPAYHYQLFPLMQGVKVLSISKSNIVGTVIHYPDILQQTKITNLLSLIDKKISVQRQLVEALKKYKRGSLSALFPKKGEITPQYRFAGFTKPWEQRKLNEVVNVYDGVHQTPDYKESGVMFLSVENISTLKSEKYISEEAFQRDYKVYPQKGDILMTRIGDVGTPNVVETTEKVAFYVSLALLKPTKINSYFLCNSIQSPLFQKGLKDRTLVTAIPQKINKDEIGKINIILPTSSQEQQLIGEYFRSLDRLITLHQHKYDTLLSLKNALLQQMFI